MKKLLTIISLAVACSASAQTLFTYGKESVSAAEFLRAFQKNSQGPATEKSLNEYLDLYIASRLKVEEAKALHYDTLPQIIADLANLRQQILPTYLADKESMDKLVKEAFQRSQKDIHLAHIFIRVDTTNKAAAEQKKASVMQALSQEDFAAVAKQYSDDPSASSNGGDLGWVTAFTLPYELETLAYNTAPGTVSGVYRSRNGYHLVKNLGERKALGRIKAAQILLALPPNSNDSVKTRLKTLADSLYNRLQAGDDFGKLATAFSNDVVSSASGGQMMEFGVGEYEPAFENAVLALSKDGAISQPFLTTHGYHIVKRLGITPLPSTLNNETKESLQRQIEENDRAQYSKLALAKKIIAQAGYQKLRFSDPELWAYTDSALMFVVPKIAITLKPTTPLMKIGKQVSTVTNWMEFAQNNRYRPDGSGATPFPQLWTDFVNATALNYYQDHLETFNEDFRRQMSEFAEGNLFFEIMQRKVWTPAQTDSVALAAYYQKHKSDYKWKESADAILFYGTNDSIARQFYQVISRQPSNWRSAYANYSEQITTDSGRFEITQLPNGDARTITAGTVTAPVSNKEDNTASFAYIVQLHPGPAPRSFADAKGLVINDYQSELEKEWLRKLKQKYPVTINQTVWKATVKRAQAAKENTAVKSPA